MTVRGRLRAFAFMLAFVYERVRACVCACGVCANTHLEHARQFQPVEDGQEEIGGDRQHDGVAHPDHTVLRAVHVHFGGRAEHGDGGHEAGEQRQRHGQHAHVAAGMQEVLRRLLLSEAAVEEADAERDE